VFGECQAKDKDKDFFVHLEKEQVHCSRYKKIKLFFPAQLSISVSGSQKSLTRLTHPFSHFYIISIFY
jgi:hypothetical protein